MISLWLKAFLTGEKGSFLLITIVPDDLVTHNEVINRHETELCLQHKIGENYDCWDVRINILSKCICYIMPFLFFSVHHEVFVQRYCRENQGFLTRYHGGMYWLCKPWPQFYQTRSAWSMDQGSTKKCFAVHNFVPTVSKFCVVWEGLSLPQDTKFGNCRDEIVDRRVILIWSLIHGSSWSGLIKVGPACIGSVLPSHKETDWFQQPL